MKVEKLWKLIKKRGRNNKQYKDNDSDNGDPDPCSILGDIQVQEYNYDDIKLITNDFSSHNLLGISSSSCAQFYKSSWPDQTQTRTVKIWVFDHTDTDSRVRNACVTSLMDEIKFLHSEEGSHMCLPKMIGCCWDYRSLAAVYDINPLGTLHSLLDDHPDCLNWSDRVHIAFKCAHLLKYLHGLEPPILARDLCAQHILLDQDKNPFYIVLSGVHRDTGALGHHTDPLAFSGVCSKSLDVSSFGGILLALLCVKDCKQTNVGTCDFDEMTWKSYKDGHIGDFHASVAEINSRFQGHHHHNSYDTLKMSKLAIKCVSQWDRPTIEMVVEIIQSLFLVSINDRGVLLCSLGELTFQDLSTLTDNFCIENTVGETQYGTLYKGKILEGWKGFEEQEVIVKIWDEPRTWRVKDKDLVYKLMDEISFLSHPRSISHPCLPRLIGFCYEDGKLGVVYKLKSIGTLKDFLLKDTFKWSDRVEIINQLVSLLHFLHSFDPPYIVGNLSASHMLISEGMQLHLVDFGMMTGGILGNKREQKHLVNRGSEGYVDEISVTLVGLWKPEIDIYAFGVVVIELMSKKHILDDKEGCFSILVSFQNEGKKYENEKNLASLFVDEGFKNHAAYRDADAHQIMKIALHCVSPDLPSRLSIFSVIERLEFFCPLLS